MAKLKILILACVGSILIYVTLFGFLLRKPLTLGFIADSYDRKAAYVREAHGPKIVILAGSNGLFSHRCETVQQVLSMPCLNCSVTAEISLDYQLARAKTLLAPGDIVLMPLEYSLYTTDEKTVYNSVSNPFMLHYDKDSLLFLGVKRVVHSLFYFDLKFLISALAEMGLKWSGVSRRFSTETLTPNGDMKGHTEAKADAYRKMIRELPQITPPQELLTQQCLGETVLRDFLKWAKSNDITVVGALPTVFNDRPIDQRFVHRISSIYTGEGHRFLILPGLSQYDRSHFYDTGYHLCERYQMAHSRMIGNALAKMLFGGHVHERPKPGAQEGHGQSESPPGRRVSGASK